MRKACPSIFVAIACAVLLNACSGLRLVDNDVVSFAQWPNAAPPRPGSSYRFERLPSQQSALPPGGISGMELSQDQLEAIARTALDKVGFLNNPTSAAFNVQVSTSTRYAQRFPYNGSAFGGGFGGFGGTGFSLGASNAGSFIGFSFPLGSYESPLYLREVSILIRDLRSNAVVYESKATHSGVWSDGQRVLPAMFEAALQGFPSPPTGPRRINIEIPR